MNIQTFGPRKLDNLLIFARKLSEIRKEKGFSQQELAERVNKIAGTEFKRTAVSNWENGTSTPKLDIVVAIANSLDVTPDELLGFGGKETGAPDAISEKGIPFYDIYAAAGPITMYSDLREYITDYIHVPGIDFNDCDFCVTVWEDSMKGKFNPGDVIICREVHDRTLLKPGASYFIITSEYKTVKDVYPGEEAENVKLVPYNKEQSPFDIALDKIIKIYHVRGRASINRIDN